MKVVRMGDHGPTVSYLQLALSRAGFGPGEIDGLFGPATRRALTAFQVSRRLIVDGVAGPLTWQALLPFLRGYIHHIVHGGDTLYQLSRLYNTTVFAILTANPGLEPALLIPGQRGPFSGSLFLSAGLSHHRWANGALSADPHTKHRAKHPRAAAAYPYLWRRRYFCVLQR